MKNVPNILSIFRILLSITLIFLINDKWLFTAAFILCGISDVLDGYVARRWKVQSTAGARLDSIADIFMFVIITAVIVLQAGERLTDLLPYIAAVLLLRLANMAVAYIKYRSFAVIHTWGNKLAGLFIFVASVVFILTDEIRTLFPLCILAALTALEEMLIHITSDRLDLDRRSIFR